MIRGISAKTEGDRMWTRRQFLHRTSTATGAALATYNPDGARPHPGSGAPQSGRTPG